jgi:putative nucleotidyltransferase with HDIG domain
MKRSLFLYLYISALSATAMGLFFYSAVAHPADIPGFWNAFAALVGLGVLAEVLSLEMRMGTVRSSAVFVPHLASILLLPPGWAMVIAGIVRVFMDSALRRKPLIKITHNASKDVVAVGVAALLYVYSKGEPSAAAFSVNAAGFLAASVVYWVVMNGGTATAVALSTGSDLAEMWNRIVGKELVKDVLSGSVAVLFAFLYIELEVLGLLLVLVPIFFVRHELHQNLELQQANRDLLELMVKSIEARDPYTSGHSVRVASYAKALARSLGLSAREIEQIETAALLHDVGKIYEEYGPLLRKQGKLTEEERRLMHSHPVRSAELVATISSLRGNVERAVRAHHEFFDGSGYPDGLAGGEIPIGARIVMVADTADAMMTDRPYRKALTYERVIEEFELYAGAQFDPEVVRAFRHSTAIRRLIDERRAAPPLVSGEPGTGRLAMGVGSPKPGWGRHGQVARIRDYFTS